MDPNTELRRRNAQMLRSGSVLGDAVDRPTLIVRPWSELLPLIAMSKGTGGRKCDEGLKHRQFARAAPVIRPEPS